MSFIGELWRNNPSQQVIDFGYAIDPAGTNSTFNPSALSITEVSDLNVAFPTSALTTINDGTQATNQVNLATTNMPITGWAPNSTLWLVWESQNPAGGAQGVAIDNVAFSASISPVATTRPVLNEVTYSGGGSGSGLGFNFTNIPGAGFTVYAASNLAPPVVWNVVGQPTEVPNGAYSVYQFVDPQATNKPEQFYKVTSP